MAMLIFPLVLGAFLAASSAAADPPTEADFLVAEGGALQGRPAVAYDPSRDRFLSVWTDYRNKGSSELDIYGRIIGPDGRPLTPDIPIVTAKRGQAFASVAFDAMNERFLVTWTDWGDAIASDSDIYGRFMNADGMLHGESFPIAKMRVSQKSPAVAFDAIHRRFLVVWVDRRDGKSDKIYGRFTDPDGNLLGAEFALALEGGRQDGPSVVFDEKRGRFLVLWRDSKKDGIYGAFVDPERGPEGARILISAEEWGCHPTSLYAGGFAPEDDVFFVAWTSGRNYAEKGLHAYGAILRGEDGGLEGSAFAIAAEIDYQEAAAVAFDPNKGRFLVVWYDIRRTRTALDMDIYGRFVSPGGRLSDEFLVSDHQASGIRRHPVVSFTPRSDAFLVLWEDGRRKGPLERRIYGRML
jgi:hypothetical protein